MLQRLLTTILIPKHLGIFSLGMQQQSVQFREFLQQCLALSYLFMENGEV